MESASHIPDAVSIDPQFEKDIGKALDEDLRPRDARIGFVPKGLGGFHASSIAAAAQRLTPLGAAHNAMGDARALCNRVNAFIDHMTGEAKEGESTSRPRTAGALGELQHDAECTGANIAATIKRLSALENVVLGQDQAL